MGQHSIKGSSRGSNRSYTGCIVVVAIAIVIMIGVIVYLLAVPRQQNASDQQTTVEEVQESQSTASVADQSASAGMSAQMQAAKRAVEGLVSSYGEDVAVCVMPVDGSAGFSINGDEQFIAASMIKLAVLAAYMDQVDAGKLDRYSTYLLQVEDIVGGAGVVQNNSPGAAFTYEQLAKYMVKDSDNTATNILIDTMGRDTVNEHARELGLTGTQLNRRMMRMNEGPENLVTANDCALLLCEIARGTLASLESCNLAESYLLAQEDNEALSLGIPSNIGFGHKTGSLTTVRHDGGIVYATNPYVIVVMTSLDESSANALMAKISKAVYDELG